MVLNIHSSVYSKTHEKCLSIYFSLTIDHSNLTDSKAVNKKPYGTQVITNLFIFSIVFIYFIIVVFVEKTTHLIINLCCVILSNIVNRAVASKHDSFTLLFSKVVIFSFIITPSAYFQSPTTSDITIYIIIVSLLNVL